MEREARERNVYLWARDDREARECGILICSNGAGVVQQGGRKLRSRAGEMRNWQGGRLIVGYRRKIQTSFLHDCLN